MSEPAASGSKNSKCNTQNLNKAGISDNPSNYDTLTLGKKPLKGLERHSADLDEGEHEDTSYDGTIEEVVYSFLSRQMKRWFKVEVDLLQDIFDHPLHFMSTNGDLEARPCKHIELCNVPKRDSPDYQIGALMIIATCFTKEVKDLLLLPGTNHKFSELKPVSITVPSTTRERPVELIDDNVPPPISEESISILLGKKSSNIQNSSRPDQITISYGKPTDYTNASGFQLLFGREPTQVTGSSTSTPFRKYRQNAQMPVENLEEPTGGNPKQQSSANNSDPSPSDPWDSESNSGNGD
ncbi:hypothetical protein BDQ17DRAFT_1328725 [Cyathus striatus]|nr:hypothetical protein BDQ17DRAFT_1328725 [Cyathus striatus]